MCPRSDAGLLLEKCEFDNPAINKSSLPNQWSPTLESDQIAVYIELMRKAGRDVSYENGAFVYRMRTL